MNSCTLFPDSFAGLNWSHCCALHDVAYELGINRTVADKELYQCVADATGVNWFAGIIFTAVSLFGWIFYKKRKKT